MQNSNLKISREILEAVRPQGTLYRLAKSYGFFIGLGQGGRVMGEELRRYKLSGVIKFSDDQVIAENLEEAKEVLAEVDVNVCGGTSSCTKIELIESKIEDLGLCDMDEFYAQRGKAPKTDLQAASS